MANYLLLTAGLPQMAAYLLSEVVFTAFYVYLTPYMELTVVGFYHMICPGRAAARQPAPLTKKHDAWETRPFCGFPRRRSLSLPAANFFQKWVYKPRMTCYNSNISNDSC